MKKLLYPIISLIVLALTACSSEYDKMLTDASRAGKPLSDGMLYATIEDAGGGDAQTKVYADEDMLVLWNANDRISAFMNYTYNQPYQFKGKDGDNAGGFAKVQTAGEPATSTPLEHIYAIYPYNEATSISNSGILLVELPAEQHYLAHSFGKGANTMVSVTDDNMLRFKNAGGYLSFKFYGDGVSVKSITLKGNNQEKLAGKASVTMSVGGAPSVVMQNDASESVTLVCDEPVALNAYAENFTEFWFVIPPTTFEQGFTVTVTDVNGGIFTKTTSNSITISRNILNRMAPIEVVPVASSHQAVDLGLPSGIKWATYNVGADSPEEYGDYFAWGETEPKENFYWDTYKWCNGSSSTLTKYNFNSSYGTVDNKTVLDLSDDAAHANWGDNWRMPTDAEWTELRTKCTWTWTTQNGKNGRLITGPNGNSIFLPVAGYRSGSSLLDAGSCGYYWSSSLNPDYPGSVCCVNFYSEEVFRGLSGRCIGLSVRPVYEEVVTVDIPDPNFKAYCVEKFDTDGDGEISISEALDITSISVSTVNIESLKGIEFMTNMESLSCYSQSISSRGKLTSLDVSNNTALTYLSCSNNQLKSLDVSNNTALTYLGCGNNQLTSLNVSNNTALTRLDCGSNQLTSLDVSKNTKLTYLSCGYNQLTALDVGKNTALEDIWCDNNQLTSLDVSKNTELTWFYCPNNQLTSLDVSKNMVLTRLGCQNNQLTSLDVSNNNALTFLYCHSNPYLTTIWLKKGQTIDDFQYDTNVATIKYKGESDPSQYEAVDLGLPSGLKWATFNVGATSPEEYGDYFAWGETESKNDYSCSNYKWCNGSYDNLTKYNTSSIYGTVDNNTQLDLSDDAASVNWGGKWRMPSEAEWTELRTECTWTWTAQNGKNGFLVTGPNGNSIFLPAAGYRDSNTLYSADSHGIYWSSSLITESPYSAYLVDISSLGVYMTGTNRFFGRSVRPVYGEIVTVDIPDPNFKAYCVETFDTDKDGEISISEASIITSISVSTVNIESLKGIEFMPNLKTLSCSGSGNGKLKTLDVSKNTALTYLSCDNNQLTSLGVSNNTALTYLGCGNNQLTSLNVSNNTALTSIDCGSNQLTSLDVSKNTALTRLYCIDNQLTNLDVSKNAALTELYCNNNQLTSLDVSNNTELTWLFSSNNQLTKLDVSMNMALTMLGCQNNQLTSLDVSENTALMMLFCYSNPHLTTIWLKRGQTISDFRYDTDVATIKYKGESDPSQYEAVDLGLTSGLKWATCNVGASRPEDYGDCYAWGELEPKTDYSWSTYKWGTGTASSLTKYNSTDGKTVLDPEDDVAHVKWGGKWRMPTYNDYLELWYECDFEWTSQNGVNGYKITSTNNGNSIFLPAGGAIWGTAPHAEVGMYGIYWLSTLNTSTIYSHQYIHAKDILFDNSAIGTSDDPRCYGAFIRPVYVP